MRGAALMVKRPFACGAGYSRGRQLLCSCAGRRPASCCSKTNSQSVVGMWAYGHARVSASGNSVEPVLLEQKIDRLLAQRLRRGLQVEREHPKLLPRLGREIDRQHALALAAGRADGLLRLDLGQGLLRFRVG